jgi:hypothetical protein
MYEKLTFYPRITSAHHFCKCPGLSREKNYAISRLWSSDSTTDYPRDEDATFTGAFIVGAKFLIGKKVTVGIDGVSEKFTKNVYNDSNDQLMGESDGSYISLIPRLDFYWLNNPGIRLYSGIGVGASFAKQSFNSDKEDKILFAFNATPIGVEAGSTICVYAETSLGYNGLINAGLRLRF